MDLAWISLAALLLVVVVSCTTTVNAGLLSIALAWILGIYVAPAFGQPLSMKQLIGGFPVDLCLTLIGVTLLFSQAHVNGTLDKVARFAVRGCRGDLGLMPVMFFLLAMVLSSIGAGNIAGTALMAPLAMTMAHRAGIPALLMAIMVAHGALAGALSPFSPTGIIADKLMQEELGLSGFETRLYLYNLAGNAFVGLTGYLLLGGWRLFGRKQPEEDAGGRGHRLVLATHDDGDCHCAIDWRRHLLQSPYRHGSVCRRGAVDCGSRGGRTQSDAVNSLGSHSDGLRRDRAHLAPGSNRADWIGSRSS